MVAITNSVSKRRIVSEVVKTGKRERELTKFRIQRRKINQASKFECTPLSQLNPIIKLKYFEHSRHKL